MVTETAQEIDILSAFLLRGNPQKKKRTAKQINMFQKHCDLKTIIQNQSSELSRGGELRWEYGGFSQLSKQTDKIPRWIDHLRI